MLFINDGGRIKVNPNGPVASKQGARFSPYIFIVSGPSGVGKTTLVHSVMKILPGLRGSVSYTTRARRPGERDSVDYHFVSHDVFKTMREKGLFLEDVEVLGECYGTSRAGVEEAWHQGFTKTHVLARCN